MIRTSHYRSSHRQSPSKPRYQLHDSVGQTPDWCTDRVQGVHLPDTEAWVTCRTRADRAHMIDGRGPSAERDVGYILASRSANAGVGLFTRILRTHWDASKHRRATEVIQAEATAQSCWPDHPHIVISRPIPQWRAPPDPGERLGRSCE